MTPAPLADLAAITEFWQARAHLAMFPLNNLRHHGLDNDHPFSLRLWLRRQTGAVSDVLALTRAGMAMPCFTTDAAAAAASAVLRGQEVTGIIGPQAAARALEAGLGLTGAPRHLDHDEPHFLLDLAQLHLTDGPGVLVPLQDAPAGIIKSWMLDYQLGTLNTPPARAQPLVEEAYGRMVPHNSHRVLMQGDQPLAMTGFNATLPEIVQIGGVYTPPALRGRGHARRAVALHLAEAAATGVQRATLFSASDMAARAYLAIGFAPVGTWTLLLFDGPQRVEG